MKISRNLCQPKFCFVSDDGEKETDFFFDLERVEIVGALSTVASAAPASTSTWAPETTARAGRLDYRFHIGCRCQRCPVKVFLHRAMVVA